jgi:type II secretory pathway component PulF
MGLPSTTSRAKKAKPAAGFTLFSKDPAHFKLPPKVLLYIFNNLASLLENGLSIPKALAIIAREPTLQKYNFMLETIRKKVEAGEMFSTALGTFPATFDKLTLHEIRTSEVAGTAGETLSRIAQQMEYRAEVKANIIKKLSYPCLVLCFGVLSVVAMMLLVIPQFEATFAKSKVSLPLSTTTLIMCANFVKSYGWILLCAAIFGPLGIAKGRKNPAFAFAMDDMLLRMPVIGVLMRDIALLQFIDVLSRMMGSGFKLVDALGVSADAISNGVMRKAVSDIKTAVSQGQKMSNLLEQHERLFPAVVSQLVIIGEQTGNLAKATRSVHTHLAKDIERKIDKMVTMIEPLMTVGMVVGIGLIMLSIYEPMFAMMSTIE